MLIGMGICWVVLVSIGFTFLIGVSARTILASAPPIYVHIGDVELVAFLVGLIVLLTGRFRRPTNPKAA